MLSVELLQALDYLLWLGAEAQAAELAHCNQSTICRRAKQAAQVFSLNLLKRNHEWRTSKNSNLLNLERHVHQLYRFTSNHLLRLESDHWAGKKFAPHLPANWLHGQPRRIGINRPMQLLQERILDTWISCTKADLPARSDSTYQVFELASTPLQLACATNHPLAQCGQLSINDLIQFPSLSLPSYLYPRFSEQLRSKGLWNDETIMRSHHFDRWEGRAMTSLSTIPVNSLSTDSRAQLITLEINLEIDDCIAVVVLKDNSEHPAIHQLLEALQRWLNTMRQQEYPLTLAY